MIKDAAVGGLLKAADVGHRGDLGFVDELFVKNQRDGTPRLEHTLYCQGARPKTGGQTLRQQETWGGAVQRAQLHACPKASTRA